MPRIPRAQQAELVYHVINRGNGRATILHKDQDYQTFLSILPRAEAHHPVKTFPLCKRGIKGISFGDLKSSVTPEISPGPSLRLGSGHAFSKRGNPDPARPE